MFKDCPLSKVPSETRKLPAHIRRSFRALFSTVAVLTALQPHSVWYTHTIRASTKILNFSVFDRTSALIFFCCSCRRTADFLFTFWFSVLLSIFMHQLRVWCWCAEERRSLFANLNFSVKLLKLLLSIGSELSKLSELNLLIDQLDQIERLQDVQLAAPKSAKVHH